MRRILCAVAVATALPAYSQVAPALPGSKPPDAPAGAQAAAAFNARSLTLAEALRLAEQANPTLRAAEASVAAAEGQLKDTEGLLWNNPVLLTEGTRRRITSGELEGQRFNEWNVGLAQTFELAGQRGYRREAAELDLNANRESIAEVRRVLRADVGHRFTRVVALQRRVELERQGLKLIDDAATAVGKRVRAGEDSRLDGNLAAVEAERTRNQLALLGEQLTQARAELATLLQLPPGALPEAEGELTPSPWAYSLDELLARAATRPGLRSLALREQAAQSKLSLERASVYPDVTVGMTTGREGPLVDGRESLTRLFISVPLPLFKRNAAGIGRATSELTQTQIERQATIREVEAQVRTLWQQVESLRSRVDRLTESVLPRLDENQRLSTIAYRAGEIGLLQLLLVNRQLLDGRRDYLEAVAEFLQTRIALEQAAGWLP